MLKGETMEIKLARIDDRFIHGQVLTRWMKVHPIERVIIVSDQVANDETRKTLILSVAPPNIKASAVTVERMVKAYASPKYNDTKVMLLFESPADVLQLVEAGVPLKEINVGGIRFENNRKQVTKSVSVSEKDIENFRKLAQMGVKLELKQLPSDPAVDFAGLMETELKKDRRGNV